MWCASVSLETCRAAAAGRSTRRGRTAACCCAAANDSRSRRWRGCRTAASTTTRADRSCQRLDREGGTARALRDRRQRWSPRDIRGRLLAFYRGCADAQIPELTTLAETIETGWPAIEVFLTTGLTNARTEGTTD